MLDPVTAVKVLGMVGDAKKALDAAKLKKTVDGIDGEVKALGTRLADEVMTELHAAFDLLTSAMIASSDEARGADLAQARGRFVTLANRQDPASVKGSAVELAQDEIRALGHLGNYYYFLMVGDEKLALIQAYRCTRDFPALAIQHFPPGLYTSDYARRLARRNAERVLLAAAYASQVEAYRSERNTFYREWAWKATKAAGLALLGAAGAAFNPSMGARGLIAAGAQLGTTERPAEPGPKPSTVPIDRHDAATRKILQDLSVEAEDNLRSLETG